MSDTSAGNAAGKSGSTKACRHRGAIFAYDLFAVFVLLVIAVIYLKYPAHFTLGSDNLNISLRAMWFGALGGIVISLKGVYDHCCDTGAWDDCFNLWHIGRPVSGALTGLITLVLLLSIDQKAPPEPVVYAIAFIFGTQERRFFNFLSEVAALVVRVPNDEKTVGLKITDVQPVEGKEGALVLITGQGFAQGATVTFGSNKLNNAIVSKDGQTIVGNVPAPPEAVPAEVNITVANSASEQVVLPGKFKYTA